jgi:hypothetical protein
MLVSGGPSAMRLPQTASINVFSLISSPHCKHLNLNEPLIQQKVCFKKAFAGIA